MTTTNRDSLDAKLLKWAGIAMVAFLAASFVSLPRTLTSAAHASTDRAVAAARV